MKKNCIRVIHIYFLLLSQQHQDFWYYHNFIIGNWGSVKLRNSFKDKSSLSAVLEIRFNFVDFICLDHLGYVIYPDLNLHILSNHCYVCWMICFERDHLVQFSSATQQLCPTLLDPMDCSTPGFPVLHQLPELLKLMSIELAMLSNHLILCHSLLLPPSIFPSLRVFPNESVLHIRWPKYWSFNFNISLSNEHPELISFRMDWLDLLAAQGTLKSLLQHHSWKA